MYLRIDDRERVRRTALLLVTTMMLGGCESSRYLNDRDLMWIWLLIPLAAIGAAGATLIWQIRTTQLTRWRIDETPVAPGVRALVVGVVMSALALTVFFVAANLQHAGGQAIVNIGLWVLGSVGGGAVALLGGLNLAESRKNRR